MLYLRLVLVSSLLFAFTACVQQPRPDTQKATPANTVAANTQPSPSPTAETDEKTELTLPMLDALLTDQNFVDEAKTGIQLTDEELQKLRSAAREAMQGLSEDDRSGGNGSTRASITEARKQLEQVLGPDRSRRFMQVVGKYSGSESLTNSKPNQVPTDTRVVVNAPAYRMDVFKDGQLVQSYKVGIGYPEFPLPTGLRSAKNIIFNPEWTPPDEPWVKGKFAPGKKVEAGSRLNPLGPIKIPIGLPSLIHGGKSPDRLGTFASHGCVGLTNPMIQDFAMRLATLAGEQLTQEDIKGYEKEKDQTKEVKLSTPIPVELRYETIVVENGILKIYRDVYERGTNTEENLNRVLQAYGVSLDSLNAQERSKALEALEQMAVDATGDPVDTAAAANSNKDQSNKNSGSTGRVTKNIKGQKVVEIPIAELAGKGYPAPVGLKG
jgi:lipoprotein-anchoring transpeptidase ErfK/SrfK